MSKLISLDPGLHGAIAFFADGMISAEPLPLAGGELDANTLAQRIRDFQPDLAVLEKVHSMPKQGVSSTFKFGMGYGSLLGILAALGVPVELTTPQAWKKVVLAGTTKDKDAAIAYCRRAFPQVSLLASPRCKVPHDGIADSLCLLEYGRRQFLREVA